MKDTLESLIKKQGSPKAIINSNRPNIKKVVFDFDEIIALDSEGKITINGREIKGNVLEIWQKHIDHLKKETDPSEIASIGFFSYDFKNYIYRNTDFKKLRRNTPLLWFGRPKNIKEIHIEDFNTIKQKINLEEELAKLDQYKKKIHEIKNLLFRGEVYQINYTQPIRYSFKGDSFQLYMQISKESDPLFGSYLDIESTQILSFSPEKFFTKKGAYLRSYPIKGTIQRTKQNDDTNVKKLKESIKDKAEHLMIVDLLRNDIGKISKFGTIKVNGLFSVKTFKTIHHMETEIKGELKESTSEANIIKALFPGGSITGAPKKRAVEIIDNIENYSRGIYTGCIGSINGNGDMDFNICIRTMIVENNHAEYSVGGGIVWDSKSKLEYLEAKEKANILKYI